jgi:hypothetical protein
MVKDQEAADLGTAISAVRSKNPELVKATQA